VYLAAVWLAGRGWSAAGRNVALGFGLLFQAAALLAPYMLSTDLYAYVFYGRMLAVYRGNPYLEVPAQYPGDPYYDDIFWKFAPSFYGPLWTLLSGTVARLAGDDRGLAALLFRGLGAASALAGSLIVGRLLERLGRRAALAGTVLLAWNPLMVIEGGLSGHNDLFMVALVALGLALTVWGRASLGIGALVLASLVKFVALALVPLVGLFVLRRLPSRRARLRFALTSGAISALLAAAVLVPVWAGPDTFAAGTLGVGGDRYVNGLGELALGELRVWLGESREETEVPLQFKGWWVATHAAASLRRGRADDAELVREIPQWTGLLVVGPEKGGWLEVYDPATRRSGYVRAGAAGPTERPTGLEGDEDIVRRERGPEGSPALQAANRIIRLVGWGGVGLVWLGALVFGTRSFGLLMRGWTATCLALFYLASAWFWPWYVSWGLLGAALAPSSWLARWTVLLSWGVVCLYATLGFGETDLWYLQTYRSLAVFGMPLALLALESLVRALLAGAGRLARRWRGARVRRDVAAPGAQPRPADAAH
jgi:hypothetical protein